MAEPTYTDVIRAQKADRLVRRLLRETDSLTETLTIIALAIGQLWVMGPPENVTGERLDEFLEQVRKAALAMMDKKTQ